MAGLGAAHQHRQRHPRQDGRRVRLRRRRRRRHRRVGARRRVDDRRRRHRRPQARVGQGVRRHPHVQLDDRPTRSSSSSRSPAASAPTCASRRSATRQVYRQAFEARDLAGTVVLVGVPRPEDTIELPFIEVFGRGGALKSSWYGDCLPSRDFPMLIDLYRQGRLDLDRFVSERSPSTTSRRRSTRWSAARSCAPSWCSDADDDRARHDRRRLRARRRRAGTSPTTSGSSATTARSSSSTPPTTTARSSTPSTAGGCGRSCSPTATTTTSTPPSRCATPSTRRSGCTTPTACCGTSCGRATQPDHHTQPGESITVGGHELGVLHTPGPLPRLLLLPRRRRRHRVLRRHAVLRRARRDRPQPQRRADDPALDPRRAAGAARRDGRAHRPRRVDDDRRRARRRPRPGRRARRSADVSRARQPGPGSCGRATLSGRPSTASVASGSVKNVSVVASANSGPNSAAGTAAHSAASARRTGASAGHGTIVGSMSSSRASPDRPASPGSGTASVANGSSGPSSAAPDRRRQVRHGGRRTPRRRRAGRVRLAVGRCRGRTPGGGTSCRRR